MDSYSQEIFDDLKDSIEWLREIVRQLKSRQAKKLQMPPSVSSNLTTEKASELFEKLDNLNYESIQDLTNILRNLVRELEQLTSSNI